MSRLQKDSTVPSVASTSQEYQENRTLRVTLLSSEWTSSTDGDFSTINRELAIQLAKQPNVDVSVCLPNCSGEDRSSAEYHNVKLIEADRIPGLDPVLWLSSPPRNHTMDCVISCGVNLGRQIPYIKKNPNYSHCKWIQVVYSDPEEGGMYKNISEGEKMLKTEIALCRMADQVITIGPKLGEAYKHYLPLVKQEVDVFELTPSILSEFLEVEHATEEGRTFSILLCESRDSCEDFIGKGYDIAAEAIAMLEDQSYKLKVVCPAGGKGNILEEKLLHHGICYSQLIVCGFYDSRKAQADLFREVDLAIMPSRTKGFGITALEALSACLPVLVSGNSGLGEALKEVLLGSQSVVDSEDPKDWAKEIRQVRQKKRQLRLLESRLLRGNYLERYSWKESCKSLVIKMRNLVFGESVIRNLQQWQQYVSRWKISSNTDVLTDLRKNASERGYRVSDNLGSGNCMFYALSEQLEIVKRVKIHHFELRRSLVQYLREHPKTVDGTDLFHFVDRHITWGGYLTDMEQDGTWGDHVILWAAANCYQIAIHVISSLPGDNEVIIKPDVPFDQSKHLVLGHVHELHYVSLQPLQGYDQELADFYASLQPSLSCTVGYDHELADFYASLQPSSTGSGRPQSSGSTELKQEEDSGSAVQKHKFDPIGEPKTSGVSSSSKRRKFEVSMEGVISQLVDVKMEPDTVQHLELKKDLLRDVEEIERSVIFSGEVTEKGNVWNLPEAAAYVTFHEGAVPKPLLFTCSVWPPKLRSPPISSDELLVSNVIELSHDGPPDLELSGDDEGNVTVALLHSASDLKGYEVVIKQLVDLHDNVWKDLETWHASEKPEVSDWPQLVEATCTPSRFSSFAVVWRLKSFTFTSGTLVAPQFICVVPDFPEIRVEVPLGSVPVDQDFTLTIKVQEFPSSEVEDIGILCGPVIHISSSQNIEHMKPVTIKVPLALRESKHDLSELSNEVIRISYLDSEGKQWRDITGQLEGPVTVKDGILEFKVKHFSRFCPVCLFTESVALLQGFFHRLFFRPMPQYVHFHTCLFKTPVPDTYSLSLYCYPNFKKHEVEKKLSSYDAPYKGEGKSKEPACVGDRIVVSPVALDFVRKSQRNEKIVLWFLGNDISDNSDMALIVRVDSESVPTVKFSKDEELPKLLCEVPFRNTRPASAVPVAVGGDQGSIPEERPALVKDGEPDDVELSDIAEKISPLWKKLGRILKVPRGNLDQLGMNYKDDAYERAFQVLSSWRENSTEGTISRYQELFDALTKIGRSDLAKKYCCY